MTEEELKAIEQRLLHSARTDRAMQLAGLEEPSSVLRDAVALYQEVKRLRTREAALVAALERYADKHNWGTVRTEIGVCRTFREWGLEIGHSDPWRVAREALAADPSAPATTEGTP